MTGLKLAVREYSHWHLALGIIGNSRFLIGSVLFFQIFEAWQNFAVGLFVIGSALMLASAIGELAKTIYEKRERSRGLD